MEKKTLKDIDLPGKGMLKWVSILMLILFPLNLIFPKYIPVWIIWIGVGGFDLMCLYIILYILLKGKAREFGVLLLNLVIAILIISSVAWGICNPWPTA